MKIEYQTARLLHSDHDLHCTQNGFQSHDKSIKGEEEPSKETGMDTLMDVWIINLSHFVSKSIV